MDGKVGREYRHKVLERGGSKDELEVLEEYLGRKPSTEYVVIHPLPQADPLVVRLHVMICR